MSNRHGVHSVTKTSPHLQRKLFYKVDVCDPAWTSEIVFNPLLELALTAGAGSNILKTEKESTKCSWNDTFLTQPATSEVRVELSSYLHYLEDGEQPFDYFGEGEQPIGAEVRSFNGPRMGTVKNPNSVTLEDIQSAGWIEKQVVEVRHPLCSHTVKCFSVHNISGVRRSGYPSVWQSTAGLQECIAHVGGTH